MAYSIGARESQVAVASADLQGRARDSVFLLVHVLHTGKPRPSDLPHLVIDSAYTRRSVRQAWWEDSIV